MVHFLQSNLWKNVKKVQGNEVIDFSGGWIQVTVLPLNKKVGYVPRVDIKKLDAKSLFETAKRNNLTFVTIEPLNFSSEIESSINTLKENNPDLNFSDGEEIHLQKNVLISTSECEDEIFMRISKKNRYYIRTALKAGTEVKIDSSEDSFEIFLKLYLETKERQGFFGRGEKYLRNVWKVLKNEEKKDNKEYIKIAIAYYEGVPHAAAILFTFEDTVYYPYAGTLPVTSSKINPNYAFIWEIIRWTKKNGFKCFDFYGLEDDEESGFSLFKKKFGGEVIEYGEPIDLVINKFEYSVLKFAMNMREKFSFIKRVI